MKTAWLKMAQILNQCHFIIKQLAWKVIQLLSCYQVFYGTEPRISVIEQPYLEILPLQDFVSPTTPFGFEVSRYDGSNQRRSTGYALALPIPSLLY